MATNGTRIGDKWYEDWRQMVRGLATNGTYIFKKSSIYAGSKPLIYGDKWYDILRRRIVRCFDAINAKIGDTLDIYVAIWYYSHEKRGIR